MNTTLTRREFSAQVVLAAGALVSGPAFAAKGENMDIELKKLPYAESALEPVISANTVSFHYGKHHAGYVKTLNGLIKDTRYDGMSLEEIVKASSADGNVAVVNNVAVFNNAAQIWNHTFYWETLAPEGKGGEPPSELKLAMESAFGSVDACKAALVDAAVRRFGSGWAWLVAQDGKLAVVSTANAETPLTQSGVKPLAVVDVWEHAYYLDWQNRRADYAKAIVDRLFDWGAISARFAG